MKNDYFAQLRSEMDGPAQTPREIMREEEIAEKVKMRQAYVRQEKYPRRYAEQV